MNMPEELEAEEEAAILVTINYGGLQESCDVLLHPDLAVLLGWWIIAQGIRSI